MSRLLQGVAKLGDLRFRVLDTSGLEPLNPDKAALQSRAAALTRRVLARADAALFVIDAR
jgi:GTP-binding protein